MTTSGTADRSAPALPAPDLPAALLSDAEALQERTVDLRRRLHRRPETGLELPETKATVLAEIEDLGLPLRESATTSAVVAELTGGRPGPTVILRADMDALPLTEHSGVDFASEIPGRMHACGHDLHTAMLAGAARLLAERRDELPGRVLLFFQPGEEGFHGARVALDEGLLDAGPGGTIAGAFAIHVGTADPSGIVSLRPGPLMAGADTFEATVHGSGGHASTPEMTRDPIPVACEAILGLQTAVARRTGTFEPAVLSVTHVAAGSADNVIPPTAWFEGTMRSHSEETRIKLRDELQRVVTRVAEAHGLTAEVQLKPGYPVTVNDDAFAARVHEVAAAVLGAGRSTTMADPLMGAEDFSYVLQRYPGAMAFLGACPPGLVPGEAPWNHSDLVVFDEAAMPAGIATYAAVALDALRTASG